MSTARVPSRAGAPTSPTAKLAVVLLILLAIPIALYAFAFQFLRIGDPTFHVRFDTAPVMAAFHVIGGGFALLAGGFQFSRTLRTSRPALHRWLGRFYLLVVLLGAIGGGVLATMAAGGLVARVGFAILAILWLWSGAAAYRAIRTGNVLAHRRWMVRNYALTFAAVTLRIELGVLTNAFAVPFSEAYPVVAWLAWVPNLIVAEWLVLRRASG